ncbi:hypothetical protein Tco_0634060 [Tanacetum coccineum]
MKLVLEQTQQGTSYKASVSAEGVEELKGKVKIKGEKKEALLILRQKPAGNPVKEILLKLNLPDHRSIITDSKVTPTKHGRMTKPYLSFRFIANCFILGIYKDGHGGRLEEEVQGLRRDVRSLRGLVERSMTDQGRFFTWMILCMAQLMDASGLTYQAFDGTFQRELTLHILETYHHSDWRGQAPPQQAGPTAPPMILYPYLLFLSIFTFIIIHAVILADLGSKDISKNIGGEFTNLEDLKELES